MGIFWPPERRNLDDDLLQVELMMDDAEFRRHIAELDDLALWDTELDPAFAAPCNALNENIMPCTLFLKGTFDALKYYVQYPDGNTSGPCETYNEAVALANYYLLEKGYVRKN